MTTAALLLQIQGPALVPDPDSVAVETLYATAHWLMQQDRVAHAAAVLRVMLHRVPKDERPWLALGECSERIDRLHVALELYGTGALAAAPSCRLHLARARLLRKLGRAREAGDALERAVVLAEESCNADLHALVRQARGES